MMNLPVQLVQLGSTAVIIFATNALKIVPSALQATIVINVLLDTKNLEVQENAQLKPLQKKDAFNTSLTITGALYLPTAIISTVTRS